MIDFRYHLVSIIAVFLALAIGIVLGTTTLRDPLLDRVDDVAATLRSNNEDLRSEVVSLRQQVEADQQLTKQLAPSAVDGRLSDERVMVVAAPGASDEMRANVVSMLEESGATVTGRLSLAAKYLEQQEKGVLGQLAAQLKPAGLRLPQSSVYERAGLVIASAVMADGDPEGNDGVVPGRPVEGGVLSGFETAGYLSVEEKPAERATLTVMIAPAAPSEGEEATIDNSALTDVAYAFDQQGEGTVVAGPKAAATKGGLTYALRDDRPASERVSSVDFADTATGRVATVLALELELEGRTGHYGIGPRAESDLPASVDTIANQNTDQDSEQGDGQSDTQNATSDGGGGTGAGTAGTEVGDASRRSRKAIR